MSAQHVSFRVLGRPQPGGSKRALPIRRGGQLTGRVAVTDANPKAKSWMQEVRHAAAEAMGDRAPLTGPLTLDVMFALARPKGHYGTGRNCHFIRPSAPSHPTVVPDATKLLRALEDALTGIAWRDDAQIVFQVVEKTYGVPERCEVTVRALEATVARSDDRGSVKGSSWPVPERLVNRIARGAA